jgi:hypothetical protein
LKGPLLLQAVVVDAEYQVSGGGVAGVISPLVNNAKQGDN